MKILHINCNYTGTTLHQLMIENLDDLGFKNQIYVPTYNKNLAVIKPNDNVIVSECFKKWDRAVFDYKQNKIFADIQKKTDTASFDLIHAYTLFTDGNCAMRLSKKYGKPYVVAVRNTDVNDFFAKMVHLRHRGIKIMQNASAVFFLSESYRRRVFERYVPKKLHDEIMAKTHIIPNGIDDFWFENAPSEPKNENNDKINLVFAGRIDKNKNVPTVQRAAQILRDKGYNVSLTVVGRPCDKGEYEKIKSDSFTNVLPAKPKEELIEIYRQNDIFVMPSFTESFGLVYAEAMSQGLPVIYSRGQGFDGQFSEGEVGYSTDSHSASELAERVLQCMENLEQLSKNAMSGARKFNWYDICRKYSEIYSEDI